MRPLRISGQPGTLSGRGVSAVAVELVPGGVSVVTITSDSELSDDAVSAAIDEAGYELAD